jgi:hypothetical protein
MSQQYHQPPSRWIFGNLSPSKNLSAADYAFALDFDAAVMRLGVDDEKRRNDQQPRDRLTTSITHKMGA